MSRARPRAGGGRRADRVPTMIEGSMEAFEIVVEPKIRRRRSRRPQSYKKRAAALFRIWHDTRDLLEEAERMGDSELVHFLAVTLLLVEERAAALAMGPTGFDAIDTGRPN